MQITVRSILHVGDSRRPFGMTPTKYRTAVKRSLAAQYPGVTVVAVTEAHCHPDSYSDEPYACLTAEGQWDDGKPAPEELPAPEAP